MNYLQKKQNIQIKNCLKLKAIFMILKDKVIKVF